MRKETILEFNKKFVLEKEYKQYETSKYPGRKIAILTCMDTRLTELLPAAMGLINGDAKIIKNAGAVVTHPFGSVMRSLLVAIYDLGVKEVYVIGHYDCGMEALDGKKLIAKMKKSGIADETIRMADYCAGDLVKWLTGFESVHDAICTTTEIVRRHPLMPADIFVYGMIMDPITGRLDEI